MTHRILAVACAALLLLPAGAAAGPSEDHAKAVRDTFNAQPRTVRADHLLLPLNYVEIAGESYGYHLPAKFARLARAGESFTIRKLKRKDHEYRIELETPTRVRLKLRIYDPGDEVGQVLLDEVFPRVLADVFVFGEAPDGPRIVVNTASGLAHRGACNHLPPPELRREAAGLDGLRLCPACFPEDELLPYDGYMPIRAEAVEDARLFMLAFPPVEDEAVQARVAAAGQAMVDAMPFETAGFDYQFTVVHSTLMQARCFATGFVFITDRLLDAIETEAELAFVLGHEIVHCELFLPPVQGSATSSNRIYANPAEQAAANMRLRESLADRVAAATVAAVHGDDALASVVSVLQKLQFATEAAPRQKAWSYASHPTFDERIAQFRRDGFLPSGARTTFVGLDEDANELCELRVIGASRNGEGKTALHIMFAVSDLARRDMKIPPSPNRPTGKTRTHEDLEVNLYNAAASYEVEPGGATVMVLDAPKVKFEDCGTAGEGATAILDPARLTDLGLLDLRDVKRWERREDG